MSEQKTRNDILSDNIQRYLVRSSMNQKQAAEKAGLNPTTLNSWVKKISYPREKTLQKLADAFEITSADLTTEHSDTRFGYLSLSEYRIVDAYRSSETFRKNVNQLMEEYEQEISQKDISH